jgi:acyl-homoserine lactone acylase PvdQ
MRRRDFLLASEGLLGATLLTTGTTASFGSGNIELKTDEYGVSHVYGDDLYGLGFGQGYIQARDRFFQMDVLRHVGYGTSASVIGSAQIGSDISVTRTGYTRAEMETMYQEAPEDLRTILQGYADGVNRRLAEMKLTASWPGELTVLAHKPDWWDPVDSVSVLTYLVGRFGVGGGGELRNARELATVASKRADSEGGPVRFHEHADYEGSTMGAGPGEADLDGWWSDRISSIEIQRGYEVELFAGADQQGQSLTLTTDTPKFGNLGFNDAVSSYSIRAREAGPVTIYERPGYKGEHFALGTGEGEFQSWWDGRVASVEVADGYELELFSGTGRTQQSLTLTADETDLSDRGFDGEASSFAVRYLDESEADERVTVYEHADYEGARFSSTVADREFDDWWTGRVSSVAIQEGYELELFEGPRQTGQSLTLTGNAPDLSGRGFDGVPDSFAIRERGEPSSGGGVLPEGTYIIENVATGTVVDIKDDSTEDGANAQLFSYEEDDDHANQQFRFEHLGDDEYRIEAVHSGKVLDASTKDSNVYQHEWHTGDNQRWTLERLEDGTYRIESVYSGEVLDGHPDKENVYQHEWHTGDNQRWELRPFENVAGGSLPDGNYVIENVATETVLDVESKSGEDGANVSLVPYVGGENQQFRIEHVGNEAYRMEAVHSGKVVDLDVARGDNVHQWSYHGRDNQRWRFESIGDGTYRIESVHSGKALDAHRQTENVYQHEYHGGDNQQWRLRPLGADEGRTVGDGTYVLQNAGTGKVMEVANGSTDSKANVRQWSHRGADSQRFRVEHVEDDEYRIEAVHSGKVLDVESDASEDGGNVQQDDEHGEDNQRWRFEPVGDGTYRIRSVSSETVLGIESRSGPQTADGANVVQWTETDDVSQRWRLTVPGHVEADDEIADGTYTLENVHSRKIAEVRDRDAAADAASVHQWEYRDEDDQRFRIEQVADGEYRIEAEPSGTVLEVDGSGSGVRHSTWTGDERQRWTITAVDAGAYRIDSVAADTALEVADWAPENGGTVAAAAYEGKTSQQWRIEDADRTPAFKTEDYATAWEALGDRNWVRVTDDHYTSIPREDKTVDGGEEALSFEEVPADQLRYARAALDAESWGTDRITDPDFIDLIKDGWGLLEPFKFGSNGMVVGSEHTETGKPMMFGGPQLGYIKPPIVYETGMHGAGFDVSGVAVVGTPAIVVGRTPDFAWSVTSGRDDMVDVIAIDLHPENRHKYRWDGEWREMECREVIHDASELADFVNGDEFDIGIEYVKQEVCRIHEDGDVMPVVSWNESENVAWVKRKSTRYDEVSGTLAWVDLGRQSSRTEFKETLREFPFTFNFLYMDEEDIALYHTGKIPDRNHQNEAGEPYDVRLPVPASGQRWDGTNNPIDLGVYDVNPSRGYIVNWNNAAVGEWTAGDSRERWGSQHRVELLDDVMREQLEIADGSLDLDDVIAVDRKTGTREPSASASTPIIADVAQTPRDESEVPIGEADVATFDQPDRDTWTLVSFDRSYDDPVVVTGPVSAYGGHPLTLRGRNVAGDGFEIRIDEWEYLDGPHKTEDVPWLAVERGVHDLDGATIQAGTVDIDHTWTTVSLSLFDESPIVLTSVLSDVGGDGVITRQRTVDAGSFDVRLQEAESSDRTHKTETVHYVAIEPVETDGLTARTVEGVDDAETTISSAGFSSPPATVAQVQTFAGPNPVTLRHRNRSDSGIDVFLQEEQSGDDETDRDHPETVGFVAATGTLTAQTDRIATMGDLLEAWGEQQYDYDLGDDGRYHPGHAIWDETRSVLHRRIFRDDLGGLTNDMDYEPSGRGHAADHSDSRHEATFVDALEGKTSYDWLDDDRDAVIRASLREAAAALEDRFDSPNPAEWTRKPHQSTFFTIGQVTGSEIDMVNRGTWIQVLAMGQGLDGAKGVIPPSNDGHVNTADLVNGRLLDGDEPDRLTNQLELYRNFEYKPFPLMESEVDSVSVDDETLEY